MGEYVGWIIMSVKISKHAKDLIQKYSSGLFKDASLEFYGIKTGKIKEMINVELPVMEVGGGAADYIFLLEDGTYLHFEFQTTYSKRDLVRFAGYDIRLYDRDGRRIITVIIYAADVKQAETELNIGSMVYSPEKIMMNEYDGNAIYTELANKINNDAEITDVDMLNLIFLPLMRNTVSRAELAVKSVTLAKNITEARKRDACIAASVAFASRYMDENKINELLEVLKMTDIATLLVEDAKIDIAKNMLKRGVSIETIAEDTGLDETIIKKLQADYAEVS
jgi:hypothetical protein